MATSTRALSRLKDDAKALSKTKRISRALALDQIARDNGYGNWKAAVLAAKTTPTLKRPKELSSQSDSLVARNKIYLASLGIDFSVFKPTKVGLEKSILDATHSVRIQFELEEFHFFALQGQGPDNKKLKTAYFLSAYEIKHTSMSVYRPHTKNGDPRMWFKGLATFAQASDQIAIIIFDDAAYLANLSQTSLEEMQANSPIQVFLAKCNEGKGAVARELLQQLKEIAKRPIKCEVKGDTAVGMAVEKALGIQANSNKSPDYKTIELKSGRGSKNRSTLFAQVANWGISPCKSSAEILDKYGYVRATDFKLYCTVSADKTNSQGLRLFFDTTNDWLIERDANGDTVAVWNAQMLRERLAEKHAETFWIEATSVFIEEQEYFKLQSVTHTKKPLLNQMVALILAGVITMDHLIKRKVGLKTTVSEKGPLFKINKQDLHLLFPKPMTYSLID